MLIYRIEHIANHRAGAFIYFGDHTPAARLAARVAEVEGSFDPYQHSTPDRWPLQREVCGLPSLDAYRTWFSTPAQRAALFSEGHHYMRVYDVPDELVYVEMLQVLFDPDDATSVRLATSEEIQ